jgi:ribosomal subunit interface protein
MTSMNPSANAAMNIQVSGKHVDVGDALRTRIVSELAATIGKVFERGGSGEVVVSRDGQAFCVDFVILLASGQQLVASGRGGDAHSAFDVALNRLQERLRRYKRRLKNHHPHLGGANGAREAAPYAVLRAPGDEEDEVDDEWGADGSAGAGAPQAAIIAETEKAVKTMTVSMAVMELDLAEAPVVLFRNAGHGGLSVVYRRTDGNIGWIDPERGRAPLAAAATGR